MMNLDTIAQDLFSKIRGRFPEVTIGNEQGNVTSEPKEARFFEFPFKGSEKELGKISVTLDEQNGVTVMYSTDVVEGETEATKNEWYEFLRELRKFSKKRMLNFNTRNINKSNLEKRDYQYLAKTTFGDGQMNESKLYGTSRVSYQDVDNARIVIKHTESVNYDAPNSRTRNIGAIYIESAEGERFKYPFKHLSGARAMARHVSEGGNAYDDFGKHIVGLSEEMSKLRKFKNYMGRSAVMAESLAEYVDVVKDRISTVKKTIESLQKKSFYEDAVANFEAPVFEDVPQDVQDSWVEQLTIRQFNEELKDVFPYIYNLVGEAKKARELGPEDIVDESGLQYYTGVKKHGKEYMKKAAQAGREGASQEELGRLKDKYSKAEKNKKTKEEFELEQTFEDAMGQFADGVCEDCGNPSWRTLDEEKQKGVDGKVCWKGYKRMGTKMKGGKRVDNCVKVKEADNDTGVAWMEKHDPYIEYHINAANNALKAGNEEMRDTHRELAKAHRRAQIQWEMNINDGKAETMSTKAIKASKEMGADIDEGNAYAHAVRKAKMDGKKKGDKIPHPDGSGDEITLEKEGKTPLGEFILSYFDRHTGQFPKGETAVLTMVEKDYGEQFIEPAKAFIEQINNLVAEKFGYKEPEQDLEFNRVKQLAGL